MLSRWIAVCTYLGLVALCTFARAEDQPAALPWYDDYADASHAARAAEQMLVIVLVDPRFPDVYDEYVKSLAANEKFAKASENVVLCKVPTSHEIVVPPSDADKKDADEDADENAPHPRMKLLAHPAFAEMGNRPGIVVIDFAHTKSKHFGRVVNIYPFKSRFLAADRIVLMMNLPEGSLTQRTMIFAVLTHPERPASANSQFTPVLAQESEQHSSHQAQIRSQGHHQWETRFHRINSRLGARLTAQEVVAESWPGQDLVEAAEECVHSWRQSSGHWQAVRSNNRAFGFDIKRGGNGIWYATGLFGR